MNESELGVNVTPKFVLGAVISIGHAELADELSHKTLSELTMVIGIMSITKIYDKLSDGIDVIKIDELADIEDNMNISARAFREIHILCVKHPEVFDSYVKAEIFTKARNLSAFIQLHNLEIVPDEEEDKEDMNKEERSNEYEKDNGYNDEINNIDELELDEFDDEDEYFDDCEDDEYDEDDADYEEDEDDDEYDDEDDDEYDDSEYNDDKSVNEYIYVKANIGDAITLCKTAATVKRPNEHQYRLKIKVPDGVKIKGDADDTACALMRLNLKNNGKATVEVPLMFNIQLMSIELTESIPKMNGNIDVVEMVEI